MYLTERASCAVRGIRECSVFLLRMKINLRWERCRDFTRTSVNNNNESGYFGCVGARCIWFSTPSVKILTKPDKEISDISMSELPKHIFTHHRTFLEHTFYTSLAPPCLRIHRNTSTTTHLVPRIITLRIHAALNPSRRPDTLLPALYLLELGNVLRRCKAIHDEYVQDTHQVGVHDSNHLTERGTKEFDSNWPDVRVGRHFRVM